MLKDIEKIIEKYNSIIEERKQFLLRHNERGILPQVAIEGLLVKDYKITTDDIIIVFQSGRVLRFKITDYPIIAIFREMVSVRGTKREILTAFALIVKHLLTDTDIDDSDIYGAMLTGFELASKSDNDPDWVL